ncbi:MAG: hypothetical protein ABFE07_13465, partial [Armatimonadia bacterium]
MKALIAKELREIWWLPVGLVAVLGAVTWALHMNAYWTPGIVMIYMLATVLLALYLGADSICADRLRGLEEWHYMWPVSRARWWWLRFGMNLVITLVVGAAATAMLVWLTQHYAPEEMRKITTYTLAGLLPSLVFPVTFAFFASG